MPGMVVQAYIDPTQLTTRILNGTRKMLASGIVVGQGGSASIARALFRKHHIPYVSLNQWGIYRRGAVNFTPEDVKEVTEIYAAYIALRKITNGGSIGNQYWDDRFRDLRGWIEHATAGTTGRMYLTLENKPYREQIAAIMTSRFDPHHIEGRQRLLTRFETGERFEFDIVNWGQYE